MMGWYGDGPGWGGWVVMSLMMLAFWALLVFGGIALFRSMRGGAGGDRGERSDRNDAQRLLDERFARGEIDEDDYTRRRQLLSSGR